MAFIKPTISIQKKKASSLSFSITIPKKEIKNAVDRNKIKRRVREIIRSLPVKNLSLRVFVSKAALYKQFSEIKDIIVSQYD